MYYVQFLLEEPSSTLYLKIVLKLLSWPEFVTGLLGPLVRSPFRTFLIKAAELPSRATSCDLALTYVALSRCQIKRLSCQPNGFSSELL